mmetsp:Transcript_29436/g.75575  ORF Transcript_29436/g.75575 Transcript_29436/m.75575 type:complete len:388 (+) Transcript_29436:167-1330(+)
MYAHGGWRVAQASRPDGQHQLPGRAATDAPLRAPHRALKQPQHLLRAARPRQRPKLPLHHRPQPPRLHPPRQLVQRLGARLLEQDGVLLAGDGAAGGAAQQAQDGVGAARGRDGLAQPALGVAHDGDVAPLWREDAAAAGRHPGAAPAHAIVHDVEGAPRQGLPPVHRPVVHRLVRAQLLQQLVAARCGGGADGGRPQGLGDLDAGRAAAGGAAQQQHRLPRGQPHLAESLQRGAARHWQRGRLRVAQARRLQPHHRRRGGGVLRKGPVQARQVRPHLPPEQRLRGRAIAGVDNGAADLGCRRDGQLPLLRALVEARHALVVRRVQRGRLHSHEHLVLAQAALPGNRHIRADLQNLRRRAVRGVARGDHGRRKSGSIGVVALVGTRC